VSAAPLVTTRLPIGEGAVRPSPRPYVTQRPRERSRFSLLNPAWISVGAAGALTLLGIYTIDVALRVSGGGVAGQALTQAVFAVVGVIAAAAVCVPHYRWLGHLSWAAMAVSVALLIFLLIPFVPETIVRPINGARGWIDLKVFRLQPAEVAKISFVLVVAQYLRFRTTHRRFLGLVPIGLIAMVPVGLITLEPDLGNALLFVPALFAMLVAAGARLRHLSIIVLCAALAAPAAYPVLQPHQKARIKALIGQISGDREGAYDINYQSFTAQTMIGAGELTGMGDRHSRVVLRFNKLPERHNDMVFSVLAARFGLLGALVTLGLYLLWIIGALLTAAVAKDPFGRLVPVGLAGFIATQVIVNIGMNIGLLPIIGVTLPFMSYGGSSMITVWLMTGLILSIGLRKRAWTFQRSFEFADEE
jgi:cell division protein FtsW (lipid II flippase)